MRIYSTKDWAQDVFAYDDYSLHTNKNAPPLKPPLHGFPYFISEAVGALDGPPLYRWIDSNATLATQAELHARKHNFARSAATYAGLLGWAGIDYASLSGGNRVWHNMKWAGVLDAFRVPKPGAAFYRSQCSPTDHPVILPVFFWDFGKSSPATGPGKNAMVATNCDFLEFTIQGRPPFRGFPDHQNYRHLEHPPVFVDLTTTKGVHPPELTIDGYVGTKKVHSIKMSGDTAGDRLELTIEDQTIEANGHDATRFTLRAVDKYGNQRPYVTGDVTLSLSGPGILDSRQVPLPDIRRSRGWICPIVSPAARDGDARRQAPDARHGNRLPRSCGGPNAVDIASRPRLALTLPYGAELRKGPPRTGCPSLTRRSLSRRRGS